MWSVFESVAPSWVNGSGVIETTDSGIEFMREVLLIDPNNAVSNRAQEAFYEYDGVSKQALAELDTEFSFRELLALNADSYKSVADFMGKWGLLYHPQRFASSGQCTRVVQRAINLTDKADETEGTFYQRVVSIDEAMLAAKALKSAVESLLALDTSTQDVLKDNTAMAAYDMAISEHIALLNTASVRRLRITAKNIVKTSNGITISSTEAVKGTERASQTTLTEQICWQAISVLTDESTSWRQCAHCGRWFKSKRDKARKTVKRSSNPPVHCSTTCQNNAKNKRWRENQKAKPRQ